MKDIKISIIIPVYNAEKFLARCLDSLVNQTYKNIEIILVDDGSTDNSLGICKSYSQKDSRVKVFEKKNGGVSSARNLGLSKATGDYITFVDADDYLDLNAYYTSVDYISKYDIQVFKFNYTEVTEDNEKVNKYPFSKEGFIEKNEIVDLFLKNAFHGNVWSLVIQKSVATKVLFNENVRIAEDLLYAMEVFLQVNNIYIINNPLYYYYINENSATNNASKLMANFEELVRNYNYSIELLNKYNLLNEDNKTMLATYRYIHIVSWHINKMVKCGMIDDATKCMVDNNGFNEIVLMTDEKKLNFYGKLMLKNIICHNKTKIKLLLIIKRIIKSVF